MLIYPKVLNVMLNFGEPFANISRIFFSSKFFSLWNSL